MSPVKAAVIDERSAASKPGTGSESPSSHRNALVERAGADGLTQRAIEALSSSEGWQRWLEARSHLVGQGFGLYNQALVAYQRPGARRVSGRAGWKRLGYTPRGEERPIRVWALVPTRKTTSEGSLETVPRGPVKTEPEPRLIDVFDQDQVTPLLAGEVAAEPPPPTTSSSADQTIHTLAQLIKFSAEIGSQVTFEPLTGSIRSYHVPATDEIVIDDSAGFPVAARVERLTIELANVLVDADSGRRGLAFGGRIRSFVACCVSRCVLRRAGLRLDQFSVTLPDQLARSDAPLVLRYAGLVDRVAGRLEAALALGESRSGNAVGDFPSRREMPQS